MAESIAPPDPTVPAVEMRSLHRRFGEVVALDDVTLDVPAGGFFTLLGPSGCGKTTLLRVIAGLEQPDRGELRLHGKPALSIPPHRRPVNTVFQSYALFPHLRVRDNVGFGPRLKGWRRETREGRVAEALALTRLTELADRWPAQLSGGQKQRVALARALVNEPEVLLLDEPLAALDLQLRRELRSELRALQRRTGITFVLVTHDQEEALALSDRLAILRAGRVEQVGTGEELYRRPRNRFVAGFLGACNLLDLPSGPAQGPPDRVRTWFGELELPAGSRSRTAGEPRTLAIRPEEVTVRNGDITGPTAPNEVPGRILERTYTGAETELRVEVGDQVLRARVTNVAASPARWPLGTRVVVGLPPSALIPLED